MNHSAPPPSRWLVLDTGPGEAAFNMALDEALMELAPRLGRPVLRFYGWTRPAATFGYFQAHADIAAWTKLRPLIRRPTGGGLVPHDADWTYALVFPPAHAWYALPAAESYARVHEWVRDAFARLGVNGELAPCCRKTVPGQCFAGHEKSDVLWQGRKMAGAAQRRARTGLLVQGSVQPPPLPLDRAAWQTAMREAAVERWCAGWEELAVAGELRARAERLVVAKYSRADYNARR